LVAVNQTEVHDVSTCNVIIGESDSTLHRPRENTFLLNFVGKWQLILISLWLVLLRTARLWRRQR